MVLVLMIQKSWHTTTKSQKEMDDVKKNQFKKGKGLIRKLPMEWINESKFFLINQREFNTCWSANADNY